MNFPMFIKLALHQVGSQFFVQGSRVFMTNKGKPTIYPMETFLITSDKVRAEKKITRLSLHSCKL